jgi:hypothetical protein
MDGFVHTQELGFGPRSPATSSHCGSSALVDTFQFAGSAVEADDAAGASLGAGAAGAAAGAVSAVGVAGAGGFGAGASLHAVSTAAATATNDEERATVERRLLCMRAVA